MPSVLAVEDSWSLVSAYEAAFDRLNASRLPHQRFRFARADLAGASARTIALQIQKGNFDFIILDCDLGFGRSGTLEGYAVLQEFNAMNRAIGGSPSVLVVTNHFEHRERVYDPPNNNTLNVIRKAPNDAHTAEIVAGLLSIPNLAPPNCPEIYFPQGRQPEAGVCGFEKRTFIKRYSCWESGSVRPGQCSELLQTLMRRAGRWIDLQTLGNALRPGRPGTVTHLYLTSIAAKLREDLNRSFPRERWDTRLRTDRMLGAIWEPPA